jgi:hypothetical protein
MNKKKLGVATLYLLNLHSFKMHKEDHSSTELNCYSKRSPDNYGININNFNKEDRARNEN